MSRKFTPLPPRVSVFPSKTDVPLIPRMPVFEKKTPPKRQFTPLPPRRVTGESKGVSSETERVLPLPGPALPTPPPLPPLSEATPPESIVSQVSGEEAAEADTAEGRASGEFYFHSFLDRPYEDTRADVKSITFPTVGSPQKGLHIGEVLSGEDLATARSLQESMPHEMHTLKFDTPVTEKAAIRAVEKWLSQPMTEEHYELLADAADLDPRDFAGALAQGYTRFGDLLGGYNTIANILREDGHIEIVSD